MTDAELMNRTIEIQENAQRVERERIVAYIQGRAETAMRLGFVDMATDLRSVSREIEQLMHQR